METSSPPPTNLQSGQDFSLAIAAGIILGMGLAGFFDGIVLHQILQWHHMITSIRPGNSVADLEANTFWDGVFHVGASLLTITGLLLLWRAYRHKNLPNSPKLLLGAVLVGAGSFDVIEGLIDHQLLGIHHVKYGPHQLAWDLGFLALGALLAAIGWALLTSGKQESKSA